MSDIILSPEGFGTKIYNRFPPRYREDDVMQHLALKRYLDACGEGGFKYNIEELNGILDFANPDQATPAALPLLYEQYGLPIFNGIPEQYLRYLLPRLGEAWSKKGSLDVIGFVASAVAGVKTRTEVKYTDDYNVWVDIYLEMDYSLDGYYPDPEQFGRLIDRFLPFYLGKRVIYTYFFEESQEIRGDENFHDHVTHTILEQGFIVHDGRILIHTLNTKKGLNVDFILNDYSPHNEKLWKDALNTPALTNGDLILSEIIPGDVEGFIDPDYFYDIIGLTHKEQGTFNAVHSLEYYRRSLNNKDYRLNEDFSTNDYMQTDECEDRVALVPVTETGHIEPDGDERKDHLTIGGKIIYFPTLNNTKLTLNDGLTTNKLQGRKVTYYPVLNTDYTLNSLEDFTNRSNLELGCIHGEDLEVLRQIGTTTYTESGTLNSERTSDKDSSTLNSTERTLSDDFKTNDAVQQTDRCVDTIHLSTSEPICAESDEKFRDVVVIDAEVIYYAALNILPLNSGLELNKTNTESANVRNTETAHDNTYQFSLEKADLNANHLGFFTNTLHSVLNREMMSLPECVDTVKYADGTIVTIFHPVQT